MPLERFDLPPPPPPPPPPLLRPNPDLRPPPPLPPEACERPGDCVGDDPADLDDDPPAAEIALEADVVRTIAGAVAPAVVEVLTTLAAAADAAAAANESGFAGKCAGAGGRSEDALGGAVVWIAGSDL